MIQKTRTGDLEHILRIEYRRADNSHVAYGIDTNVLGRAPEHFKRAQEIADETGRDIAVVEVARTINGNRQVIHTRETWTATATPDKETK